MGGQLYQIRVAFPEGCDPSWLERILSVHFVVERGQGVHVNGLPPDAWLLREKPK